MHTTSEPIADPVSDPITYKGCVYPWQCDQVGHMNIMWYVGKFDEANWNHMARVGLTPSYLRTEERGMAAVQQNITYKRELLAGEIVEIRSRFLEVRDKALRFVHEMRKCGNRRSRRDLRNHRRSHRPVRAQGRSLAGGGARRGSGRGRPCGDLN